MTKSSRVGGKADRRQRRQDQNLLPSDHLLPAPRTQACRKPLEPLTEAQRRYINAINVYDLVFSIGPAGTGKTYVSATMAADAFISGAINKIVITRPAVAADEEHGFLPGDLDEKVAPWAAPVLAVLEERLGAGRLEYELAARKIVVQPLGMLGGHTFKDAWVLFTEAQNATPIQMELVLTRIGQNCRMIVEGDPRRQQYVKGPSGLLDAIDRMSGHPQVGVVRFEIEDIVRSGLCRDILERYAERRGATVGHAELGRVLAGR